LWFHAFDRSAPIAILEVLATGPGPNPNPDTGTRRNEIALGIERPCVYAYLGRTIEAFGKRAIVLAQAALNGLISPFDSGGLVNHIEPVCRWENGRKRELLRGHTWETGVLTELLLRYPGDRTAAYLNGQCPEEEGPHQCLPVSGPTAAIWDDSVNTWRAWTWEGRSETALRASEHLVAWTCRPEEYAQLLSALPQLYDDARAAEHALAELAGKYRDGGVSHLVAELRVEQELGVA
jgi:hypothetical protein